MAFLLKRYEVHVNGFSPYSYDAVSAGQARVQAWHSYGSYRCIPFKEFMKISVVRRGVEPEGYGRPILVSGAPGYFVSNDGHYVRFARDDMKFTVNSHPLDVKEIS